MAERLPALAEFGGEHQFKRLALLLQALANGRRKLLDEEVLSLGHGDVFHCLFRNTLNGVAFGSTHAHTH